MAEHQQAQEVTQLSWSKPWIVVSNNGEDWKQFTNLKDATKYSEGIDGPTWIYSLTLTHKKGKKY